MLLRRPDMPWLDNPLPNRRTHTDSRFGSQERSPLSKLLPSATGPGAYCNDERTLFFLRQIYIGKQQTTRGTSNPHVPARPQACRALCAEREEIYRLVTMVAKTSAGHVEWQVSGNCLEHLGILVMQGLGRRRD
jgi:hypothetical protein